ncbi:MAG: ABC transporter ATP-binding protein [Betaproteobacteria bacterium]|nr:ABC transporter ATP-binding protein [Betaproteobacteria bacterium]
MSGKCLIELKDVHKGYQLGKTTTPALRGVNFSLAQGDFTAVVGASGSGKSTLLNMVGCIDVPDSGEVLLEGRSVLNLSDNEKSELRNLKIGFIFQTFNLIPVLNVFDNVELPLTIQAQVDKHTRTQRVREALEKVGLSDFQKHLPDQLSGGQRQRVAIARALVTQPALVLADEPTANLDSVTAHKIIDLMLDINARTGVTFLFSTHDEKLMGRVRTVVRLQDGLIVESDAVLNRAS